MLTDSPCHSNSGHTNKRRLSSAYPPLKRKSIPCQLDLRLCSGLFTSYRRRCTGNISCICAEALNTFYKCVGKTQMGSATKRSCGEQSTKHTGLPQSPSPNLILWSLSPSSVSPTYLPVQLSIFSLEHMCLVSAEMFYSLLPFGGFGPSHFVFSFSYTPPLLASAYACTHVINQNLILHEPAQL